MPDGARFVRLTLSFFIKGLMQNQIAQGGTGLDSVAGMARKVAPCSRRSFITFTTSGAAWVLFGGSGASKKIPWLSVLTLTEQASGTSATVLHVIVPNLPRPLIQKQFLPSTLKTRRAIRKLQNGVIGLTALG
jgi:hypothetical protein